MLWPSVIEKMAVFTVVTFQEEGKPQKLIAK